MKASKGGVSRDCCDGGFVMVYGVSTTSPFESKKFSASQCAHWNSVVPFECLERLPQKWQLCRQNILETFRDVLSHSLGGFDMESMSRCVLEKAR